MFASTDLQRSPTALNQLFLIQRSPAPAPATEPSSGSPIRQFHLHLLPADGIPAFQRRSTAAPETPADHVVPSGIVDDFTTPTGDAHLIPTMDGSGDCPPTPKKRRPSTSAGPACRKSLVLGELSVPAEEVERLFGRTWTRTPPMSPAAAAIPVTGSSSTAVLPVKKRKRCYAEAAA